MVKDRGMKKWTALMLPEHTEKLKAWDEALAKPVRPSELMPWELEAIELTIDIAYRSHLPVSFTLFINDKWETVTGFIRTIDLNQSMLVLETTESLQPIPFDSIQGADIDD